MMSKHIGILACSAEGAALCYRTICAEAAVLLGPNQHPEISLHGLPLSSYVRALDADDLDGVADLMLESADKLRASGADLLICPDNTIHQAFDRVLPRSPLPWLHIAEVVAAEAVSRGFRRVGLFGTHWLVKSNVYPDALGQAGIECVRPGSRDIVELGRIIMDELVPARLQPGSVRWLEALTRKLRAEGCDAVVLGCTELPLVLDDESSALPTLDSTRLLAKAALARAI